MDTKEYLDVTNKCLNNLNESHEYYLSSSVVISDEIIESKNNLEDLGIYVFTCYCLKKIRPFNWNINTKSLNRIIVILICNQFGIDESEAIKKYNRILKTEGQLEIEK